MHATPQMITSALQLYFTGESFRNIQKFLRLQGVKMSHVAIYKWVKKYVGLMQVYLEKIMPNVSDAWRADELYVKVRGNCIKIAWWAVKLRAHDPLRLPESMTIIKNRMDNLRFSFPLF
jgi:transposase-like protein